MHDGRRQTYTMGTAAAMESTIATENAVYLRAEWIG